VGVRSPTSARVCSFSRSCLPKCSNVATIALYSSMTKLSPDSSPNSSASNLPELFEVWQQTLGWQPSAVQQEQFQQLYEQILDADYGTAGVLGEASLGFFSGGEAVARRRGIVEPSRPPPP
jgi:hypothetical protein